jgi:hypothetical protein
VYSDFIKRYGPEPYIVELELKFPETMPDYKENGQYGKLVLELGPLEYIPYSVYKVHST